jgi:tetratricopeptide (TPR) repeat protein
MRKTTTHSAILVIALLAARLAWAGTAEDRDRQAARTATRQATAAYNLGHYDEAASLYEEAYRLVPDPILLYNLGQSYRQANKLDKSLTAYRSYLRTAPEEAPNRGRVENWIRELEQTISLQAKAAALKAAQEKETQARVPPASVAPVPPEPQMAPVPPAKAAPEALAPVLPAPTPKFAPELGGQPASQPVAASQGWWLGRTWTWIAAGSTVLLAAGAVAADLSMYAKIASSTSYPCGAGKYCYSSSDADAINSRMVAAEVLAGVAAAAAVTTIVLFFVEGRPVSVAPVAGGMTGAVARVGF